MLLALDIGTKRTGVALADKKTGMIIALDIIQHTSPLDLTSQLKDIIQARRVDELVVGNPLLLSGEAGSQAVYVQSIVSILQEELHLPVHILDERFTSIPHGPCANPDARSACILAELALEKPKESI